MLRAPVNRPKCVGTPRTADRAYPLPMRTLVLGLQWLWIAFVIYHVIVAVWGWATPPPAPRGGRTRRLRVVVPAHDEAGVIEGILGDLDRQDYTGPVDVWVVADHCTDETAAVAAGRAHVAVRDEEPAGKGAALRWFFARHPLSGEEAAVIFDADTRIPPTFLSRVADELDAGHGVLQAYLDVSNPDGSILATASALTYWAGNRMVQLARRNIGWSADLGGTGMVLTAAALEAVGGFGDSLTEDQELGARFALAGVPVVWLHDVRIYDEKPIRVGIAVRQRARWMAGRRSVAKRYLFELMATGIRRRSLGTIDVGLRLVQPGRSFMALVSGLVTVVAALSQTPWLLPWQVWLAITLVQVLAPVPFLLREGLPLRQVVKYPAVVVIALLWLPVAVLSSRVRAWRRTPHGDRN